MFNPGFPSPSLLVGSVIAGTGLSPSEAVHSNTFLCEITLSAFARRYSRNRCCFLFLWLLRCFTSPRSLLIPMHSRSSTLAGGLPHSEIPGSQPCYRLLWAYRRFTRPSSPLDAKTSTVRPCCLITPTGRRDPFDSDLAAFVSDSRHRSVGLSSPELGCGRMPNPPGLATLRTRHQPSSIAVFALSLGYFLPSRERLAARRLAEKHHSRGVRGCGPASSPIRMSKSVVASAFRFGDLSVPLHLSALWGGREV